MTEKPGWKTSEFWLTMAATLVGIFVLSGVLPTDHIVMKVAALAMQALAAVGYSYSRGLAKQPKLKEPDWAKDK
jgi:hypothetical protein